MAEKSKIEWTAATWNPVRGCTRISPGCLRCYAERMAARNMPGHRSPTTGEPFAIITPSGPRWTGKVELIPEKLEIPLRRKKPTTYFVNSMSDLFHESLLDEAIDRVFAVMALCPQHTFQVLTKRSKRMREYFGDLAYRTEVIGIRAEYESGCDRYTRGSDETTGCSDDMLPRWPLPLPNVHLGVSCEDQERADERIPDLLLTPATVRFSSAEPLLGPIDLTSCGTTDCTDCRNMLSEKAHGVYAPHLDWCIAGGESGPNARPCDVAWIRSIVRQCKGAGVPVFVKQLGARPVVQACRQHHYDFGDAIGRKARFSAVDKMHPSTGLWRVHFTDRKGGDPAEWAEDLRVRELPEVAR